MEQSARIIATAWHWIRTI